MAALLFSNLRAPMSKLHATLLIHIITLIHYPSAFCVQPSDLFHFVIPVSFLPLKSCTFRRLDSFNENSALPLRVFLCRRQHRKTAIQTNNIFSACHSSGIQTTIKESHSVATSDIRQSDTAVEENRIKLDSTLL